MPRTDIDEFALLGCHSTFRINEMHFVGYNPDSDNNEFAMFSYLQLSSENLFNSIMTQTVMRI